MNDIITYIGLDVHKQSISVGLADSVGDQEVRFFGRIANTTTALRKLVGKLLSDRDGRQRQLCFCYEAGLCGYGVYRDLLALGHECVVVAPSLITDAVWKTSANS